MKSSLCNIIFIIFICLADDDIESDLHMLTVHIYAAGCSYLGIFKFKYFLMGKRKVQEQGPSQVVKTMWSS